MLLCRNNDYDFSCCYTLKTPMNTSSDIIPLYQNGVYRLKYDISSTVNRTVDGMIQQNGGDYQAYTSKRLSLTPEVQTVDYEFTIKNATDIMARLQFNYGNFEDNFP